VTIISIGSTIPSQREIDTSVVDACDLIVCDAVDEVLEQTGDMLAAERAGVRFRDRAFSLHELMSGGLDARVRAATRSLFKSVGGGLQTLSARNCSSERCSRVASPPLYRSNLTRDDRTRAVCGAVTKQAKIGQAGPSVRASSTIRRESGREVTPRSSSSPTDPDCWSLAMRKRGRWPTRAGRARPMRTTRCRAKESCRCRDRSRGILQQRHRGTARGRIGAPASSRLTNAFAVRRGQS
jgi:hypothetical protein